MQNRDKAFPMTAAMLAETFDAKEIASWQARRARLMTLVSRGLVAVTAVSMVANLGLAWGISSMIPLTKLVPVYLMIRQDGTIDTSVALSTLPASANDAVIRAALWQYVNQREGYSYDTAQYRYDVVSAMSDANTRSAYQHWFNYPNPVSPQVTIGKNGTMTVEPISVAMIAPNVAQVRYQRDVIDGENGAVKTTWTATLQFVQADTIPAKDRLNNPGGIVITSYQNEENTAQ